MERVTRLCHMFSREQPHQPASRANQFRLLLHATAYWLLDTLRRWMRQLGTAPLCLDTLRQRLVKIGGRLRKQAGGLHLCLASSHPAEPLWRLLANRFLSP